MLTTSSVFLRTLAEAGITHAFVNWGSDHPALLEDLERQRVQATNGRTAPEIITCPNEMVALSAAQGYAQVTGKPAAVIVHVDVGTQAMAGAIHNVDRGRTPVLIYAGASPFSSNSELKGSRNEFIMWLQDVPDQAAIVRQYMRHTAQINSGKTVAEVIKRSLQIAMSQPRGPVYLWARREVMEQEIDASLMERAINIHQWPPIEPSALSPTVATRIATALLTAQFPLIITSNLGRNTEAIPPLVALSTLLSIPIFAACPSVVNVPFSHPYFCGLSYLPPGTHTEHLEQADVILILESDIPWIPSNNKPQEGARVFVIDSGDPLKVNMGSWHVDAELVCKADPEISLDQIVESIRKVDKELSVMSGTSKSLLGSRDIMERGKLLAKNHSDWIRALDLAENSFPEASRAPDSSLTTISPSFTVPNVIGVLRTAIQINTPNQGLNTLVLNEGISNYTDVWSHLRPEAPGSVLTSGGSSLGWSLAAAIGGYLGAQATGAQYDLITAIVGDGSFMFSVPSSAYWIARKYETPFLTIVLNNGGWKSPKLSMLGVYPTGHGSKVLGNQLTVGFGPDCPDYSQIAIAASAGWAWGRRVDASGGKQALEEVIAEAIKVVVQEKRCAVVDCVLESI